LENRKVSFQARDLLARVIQHEIDHLNGILMIDYLNFFQKIKIELNKLFKNFK